MTATGAPGATELDERLTGSPYQGYLYAYPHKTAYRRLEPGLPLRDLWAGEDRGGLFLYLHVPFCAYRCGFCNLFTQANPRAGLTGAYLDALERQAAAVDAALGARQFARLAIGGGTPTFLEPDELARLLDLATALGADPRAVPASIELSPETATPERVSLLVERGVSRLSLGVQSFVEAEARASGRPQRTAEVEQALEVLRSSGAPVLNLDLIYGLPGQTAATFLASLELALTWRPEELFLYPLYVRPLTGLARREATADDALQLACYRQGRELLLAAGYQQRSMRLFALPDSGEAAAPAYCCQADGMVGLGSGARSYTRAVHYASEYAVAAAGVKAIVEGYAGRADFGRADWGFRLDEEEQRRRWVIQSLLHADGLVFEGYRERFGCEPLADLPELAELEPRGLARYAADRLELTPAGLERSDVIGPWLTSPRVRERMAAWEAR